MNSKVEKLQEQTNHSLSCEIGEYSGTLNYHTTLDTPPYEINVYLETKLTPPEVSVDEDGNPIENMIVENEQTKQISGSIKLEDFNIYHRGYEVGKTNLVQDELIRICFDILNPPKK